MPGSYYYVSLAGTSSDNAGWRANSFNASHHAEFLYPVTSAVMVQAVAPLTRFVLTHATGHADMLPPGVEYWGRYYAVYTFNGYTYLVPQDAVGFPCPHCAFEHARA